MKVVHVLDSANFDFSFPLILCRNTQEFMEIIKLKFAESKTCTRVMNFCTESFFLIYVMLKCQTQSQLVYFRQLPQAPMLFRGASELHKLARFNTGVNGENPEYLTNESIFHRFLVQALRPNKINSLFPLSNENFFMGRTGGKKFYFIEKFLFP